MKIHIRNRARKDLRDAFHFYENQSPGWGRYFMDCLMEDIDSLLDFHGIHPMVSGKLHRALAKKFNHAIYYRVADDEIVVRAVIDCRRNPAWIHRRLGGR